MSDALDVALLQLLLDARPRIRAILEMSVTTRTEWEGGIVLCNGGRAVIATGELISATIGGKLAISSEK